MDDPRIIKLQRYGELNSVYPHCPECGEECTDVFVGIDETIVGCSECVKDYLGPATCPVCGMADVEWLYFRGDESVGCSECCYSENAWEHDECFHAEEERGF